MSQLSMQTKKLSILLLVLMTSSWTANAQDRPPEPETDKSTAAQAEKAATTSNSTTANSTTAKSNKPEKKKEDSKAKVHRISFSGSYVDHDSMLPFDPTSLLLGGGAAKQKSFYKLCDHLDDLAKDNSIAHIVFDLSDSNVEMNVAQLDEFSRRMKKLKQSNKKTIAWLESASNVQLAISATCDQVIMADFGIIDMPSTSMQSIFYRDAMDLFGIKASVIRAGDYKGAVEPYVNSVMSDHLRQHYHDMLVSINDALVTMIASGRGLTSAQVIELQKKRMLLPQQALSSRLVDRLAPYGSMQKTIDEIIGKPTQWVAPVAKPKREISIFELMSKMMSGSKSSAQKTKDNTIVVMHLSGPIEDGKKASPGSIVSGPTVKVIDELAQDEMVRAVVVRINSPGGSATASEAIRQSLKSLAAKKPTIISMGEMAASGGYWVSCIGQPIYAEQGTITGSIGVFTMKLSFGNLMRRMGLHMETIALDDAAGAFGLERAWSDKEEKLFQPSIDEVYDRFLKLVNESRGIPLDKLKLLAGGRVWSGSQAKANGLIDAIGGLDSCLDVAAKKAGLSDYKVVHRPIVSSGIDLLELLGENDQDEILTGFANPKILKQLQRQGFQLQAIRAILNDAIHSRGSPPKVWAMDTAQLQVR